MLTSTGFFLEGTREKAKNFDCRFTDNKTEEMTLPGRHFLTVQPPFPAYS
jgi:hypothetical protein